jgi:hypothetical protein
VPRFTLDVHRERNDGVLIFPQPEQSAVSDSYRIQIIPAYLTPATSGMIVNGDFGIR